MQVRSIRYEKEFNKIDRLNMHYIGWRFLFLFPLPDAFFFSLSLSSIFVDAPYLSSKERAMSAEEKIVPMHVGY